MHEILPGTPPFDLTSHEPPPVKPSHTLRGWWWSLRPQREKWAPLPLRVGLGVAFMIHGGPKLFDTNVHEDFLALLYTLHLPSPPMLVWLVGVLEFFGGLALLTGVATSFVSALLTGELVVSLFTARGGADLASVPSVEATLLYIVGLVVLILLGPTWLSVDKVVEDSQMSPQRPPH